QSSSASRFTAGASGFFILTQSGGPAVGRKTINYGSIEKGPERTSWHALRICFWHFCDIARSPIDFAFGGRAVIRTSAGGASAASIQNDLGLPQGLALRLAID